MTALLLLLFVVVVGYAVKALCELIRDYEQLVRFTKMWKPKNYYGWKEGRLDIYNAYSITVNSMAHTSTQSPSEKKTCRP